MKMPSRPRQHQLETESREAFKSLLPTQWVSNFSHEDKEYGIDGEVQVFSHDGTATGLFFKVQLKSTDATEEPSSESIAISTFNYLNEVSVDTPVLMVLYHADSKNLYVKWFHSFDPGLNKNGDVIKRKSDADSISFYWKNEELWNEASVNKIVSDLTFIRQIKTRQIKPPFNFHLSSDLDEICEVPIATLLNQLNLDEDFKGIFKFKLLSENCHGFLNIKKEKIKFGFYHQRASNIHNDEGYNYDLKDLTDYIKLSALHSLRDNSFFDEMNKILNSCLGSKFLYQVDIFRNLALETFIKYKNWQLFEQVFINSYECIARPENSERYVETCVYLNFLLLCNSDGMPADTKIKLRKILDDFENKDNNAKGMAFYNQANMIKNDHKRAFILYNKARKLRPEYLESDYFLKELGGVLFCLHRFKLSAAFYKRSFDIRQDAEILPLYADALLFGGKYKEAFDNFAKVEKCNPEWILKRHIIEKLIIPLNACQNRKPTIANVELDKLFHPQSTMPLDKNTLCILKNILTLDNLNHHIWFNIGLIANALMANGENVAFEPYMCFLATVLFDPPYFDHEAAAYALMLSIQDPKNSFVFLAILQLIIMYSFDNTYPFIEKITNDNIKDVKGRQEHLKKIIELKEKFELAGK